MTATTQLPDDPAEQLEDLLESSFVDRRRRLPRRELLFEGVLTLAFIAASGLGFALGAGAGLVIDPALVALVLAYALASQVAYPLGAGNVVPTQPFLVAMFALAPPLAVPAIVCLALALGTAANAMRTGARAERLVFSGGNAFHALGPALVLTLAGAGRLTEAGVLVLLAALAAQVTFDLGSSTLREWVASRIRPHLQAQIIGQVFAVDLALAPLGYIAALSLGHSIFVAFGLLPLVALLGYTARDRLRSVGRAHGRLVALRHERQRLRLAVRQVGEALGSNLDLSAQLRILTEATVEALNAGAGRAVPVASPGEHEVVRKGSAGGRGASEALRAAEQALAGSTGLAHANVVGWDALACRIEHDGELVGTLAVVRHAEPFDRDDAALMQYLCVQAGVSAANVLRHESLHQQAVVDEMTGLGNHRRFQELLGQVVERHAEGDGGAALVMFDLDNFKRLNDTYGHQFGDHVLRQVAQHLVREAPPGTEPARYGGEELALILPGADASAARLVAERVRRAVASAPLRSADGQMVRQTLSAGVAVLGKELGTREALVRAADDSLYAAKRQGKNRVVVHNGAVAAMTAAEPGVHRSLAFAIRSEELRLEYQPIVELSTGRPVGVEALVRWQHPDEGLIGPGEFLQWAEDEGLMPDLGRWVLATACEHMSSILSDWPGLLLSVNVAPSELAEATFCGEVAATLRATGMSPRSLIFELTEVSALRDIEETGHQLTALRRLGVRIAIDDFGTGHAGLDHLLDLPADAVKIPLQYIARLDGPVPRDRVLCENLIELVRRTGLGVIAEGVERPEQRRALLGLGVELAQGFLFARPLSPEALAEFLRSSCVAAEDEVTRRRLARADGVCVTAAGMQSGAAASGS